jgi:outer membrane protein assembly factor BamB
MRKLLLAMLFAALPLSAQLSDGDLVAHSFAGLVEFQSPLLVVVSTRSTVPFPTLGAGLFLTAANGHVYDLSSSGYVEYDAFLHKVRAVRIAETSYSMTVDASGTAYVLGETGTMFVYDAEGALRRQFKLPGLAISTFYSRIDLASDQCSLHYTDGVGQLRRFNVCGEVAQPPIAEGKRFTAIRALFDGGFAGVTGGKIEFYDVTGRVIHTLNVSTFGEIRQFAFDSDPAFIWINAPNALSKMRVKDGVIVRSIVDSVSRLAVIGEQRPTALSIIGGRRRSARS